MITLSELSERRLKGVHPDLVAVVRRAAQLANRDLLVVEGLRSVSRQKELVAKGASTTMNSRHITGHAVDLCCMVDGKLAWGKPHAQLLAERVKAAAAELNVELDWGGDWQSFVDTPHFELDWAAYPKQDASWKQASAVAGEPPAPVAIAVKESKTILGGLIAGLGTVLQFFSDTMAKFAQFAADALTSIAGLEPITQLASAMGANLPALGFGMAATGVVMVIARRLDAAAKGKIG